MSHCSLEAPDILRNHKSLSAALASTFPILTQSIGFESKVSLFLQESPMIRRPSSTQGPAKSLAETKPCYSRFYFSQMLFLIHCSLIAEM